MDRLADLFRHNVHFQTTSDSCVGSNCENSHRRMAGCTGSPRLGDWALCHHADHVHFFCSAEVGAKTLPTFMQAWKQWTSKRMARELSFFGPVWQEEFFDHLLRSSESYSQKWDYVKENPVRAGLVANADEWPWQGEVESLMLQPASVMPDVE